jgi:glutathione S-transferase
MREDQDLFSAYAFYAGVVTLKMLVMSFLTARQRFANGVFISSEDIKGHEKEYKAGQGLSADIERVRRAHQNDIENIVPFAILGFLYIFTNPAYSTALFCFRLFAGARILHTLVYLLAVPQPARALCFFANIFTNIFMAYSIITATM